ncbi:MAG: hypothetical protein LH645_09430 [Actinomycetia bacterium]|nr:hypothetical protein [Actinomycetes bacterium]
MRKQLLIPAGMVLSLVGWVAAPAEASTVVGLWHMDDSGTVMNDSSANNLDGTLSSNVETGVDGSSGNAFQFPKKPSWVSVPNSTKLNPGTGTFTIGVRVLFTEKPSSTVGDYDLVRKGLGTTTGGNWKLEILQNGYAYCQFQGSSGKVTVSRGPDLSDGHWHTISCTRYGSSVRITVNGSSTTKSGSTGTIANTSTMYVGAKDSSGEDQYVGLLDELRTTAG